MPFWKKLGRTNFRSWNLISYLLASFVLLTIATNLYLSHAIMGVYTTSVRTNAAWAAELKRLSKLESLAQKIVAHGYSVFDSSSPDDARAARNAALSQFFEYMKGLEDRSTLLMDMEKRSKYHQKLNLTNEKINLMVNEEDQIFQYFELGLKDKAASHMVTMSRRSAEVVAAISALIHVFQDYQVADLEAQNVAATEFDRYAKYLAVAIILLVLCVVAYGHNMSNVMQAHERELADKSTLVAATLENMAQGIVVFDGDHRLVAANSHYEKMFGFPPDFLVPGLSLEEITKFRVQAGHFGVGDEDALVKKRTTGRGLLERNGERTLPDGRSYVYHRKPMPNGGMVVTYTDISDRQRMENDLRKAKEMAESADRSKSEFLANMSHEIRTPMNVVIGMSEVLAGTALDDRQQSFVQVIRDSGHNLLKLINDILDFSKIDAGQLVLDCQPFDFKAAAEDIGALISPKVAEKNIELALRFQPFLPTRLVGDCGRIRQVLLNLISNAVKFTDHGHVLVDVTGQAKGDIVDLMVRVQDTGIGIAPEMIDSVFQKFTQADGSSTRRFEGTGLGLTISKTLVELMGGTIGVESVPGEGSTFWISLSLPIHQRVPEKKRVPVDVSDARILVVDDNEVNRTILVEQFGSWQFRVAAIPSGREALVALRQAAAEDDPFDLVVLDYHMPGMNGEDTAREIRGPEACKDIPIILLTSVDRSGDAKYFRDLGVQEYLVKPANSSKLFNASIEVLMNSRQTRKSARRKTAAEPEDAKAQPEAVASSGICVLVVEDNETNQVVMEYMLEDLGHGYRLAENGREALDILQSFQPDLILMDVAMPVMSGIEATRQIRKMERDTGRHVPIIGVTAHALSGDREKCLAAGMDDYLSKPVIKNALAEKIDHWTTGAGHQDVVA